MRQTHAAGEKLFVDYAGDTVPVVVDRLTGEWCACRAAGLASIEVRFIYKSPITMGINPILGNVGKWPTAPVSGRSWQRPRMDMKAGVKT